MTADKHTIAAKARDASIHLLTLHMRNAVDPAHRTYYASRGWMAPSYHTAAVARELRRRAAEDAAGVHWHKYRPAGSHPDPYRTAA